MNASMDWPSRRDPRQQRGRDSEQLARAFRERQGYQIEAANVRFRMGELDLVGVQHGILCIVEVRSRSAARFGPAAASILHGKRQRLIRAAQFYLQRRRPQWQGNVRFDVVAIDYPASGEPAIQLIPSAFTLDR